MTATADQPDPGVENFDAAPESIDLTPQLTELLTCASWRLRRAARREFQFAPESYFGERREWQ